MEKRDRIGLIASAVLVTALALSSCNLPGTTETPLVQATPTILPATQTVATIIPVVTNAETPGETPSAQCDHVEFISDVTYPDNATVEAGEKITKTWRVKNIGDCAWDSTYRLVFVRGEQMDGKSPAEIIRDPVAPGTSVDLSIELIAPAINGTHWGVWQIQNADGKPLLKADGEPQELSILIEVKNGVGGNVTSIRGWSYTYEGVKCTSNVRYNVSVIIYANGPVSVKYTWVVSNGLLMYPASQDYSFSGAGDITVTMLIMPPFADPNNVTVSLSANGKSSSFTICP